jgi:hypothetical protein
METGTRVRPLRCGDVVTKTSGGDTTRGVVVKLEVQGVLGAREALVTSTSGYRGCSTHTSYGVGDGPDEWQTVPWDEQTWEERVIAAAAAWRQPDWVDDPGYVEYDPDTYAWALFEVFTMALRPVSEDGLDWPTDWLELAVDFARRLDGEIPSTGLIKDARKPRPCLAARDRR